MTALREKQEIFCLEYVKDFNATQAYVRAGYASSKSNSARASQLLAKSNVSARVRELIEQRKERTKVSVDYVVTKLVSVLEMCMEPEPILEWDPELKAKVPSGLYKFDSTGANKALEALGKHTGAFEKDHEQAGKFDIIAMAMKLAEGSND